MTVPVPPLAEQRAITDVLSTLDDKIDLNRRMNASLERLAAALFRAWFVDFEPVRANSEGREPVGIDAQAAALFPDQLVESEVGEIPDGWQVGLLGDLIELAYGKALRETDRRPGAVPVYGSGGPVGTHDMALIDRPGIVVGRKGNSGAVSLSPEPFFPIDTTFYVEPVDPRAGHYFSFHLLQHLNLGTLNSDSVVPGLNRNIAYLSKCVIPPQKVVSSFERLAGPIYGKLHANQAQNRTLAALRDLLLPRLLSGELRVAEAEALVP